MILRVEKSKLYLQTMSTVDCARHERQLFYSKRGLGSHKTGNQYYQSNPKSLRPIIKTAMQMEPPLRIGAQVAHLCQAIVKRPVLQAIVKEEL
jgi:hypothetical protein